MPSSGRPTPATPACSTGPGSTRSSQPTAGSTRRARRCRLSAAFCARHPRRRSSHRSPHDRRRRPRHRGRVHGRPARPAPGPASKCSTAVEQPGAACSARAAAHMPARSSGPGPGSSEADSGTAALQAGSQVVVPTSTTGDAQGGEDPQRPPGRRWRAARPGRRQGRRHAAVPPARPCGPGTRDRPPCRDGPGATRRPRGRRGPTRRPRRGRRNRPRPRAGAGIALRPPTPRPRSRPRRVAAASRRELARAVAAVGQQRT